MRELHSHQQRCSELTLTPLSTPGSVEAPSAAQAQEYYEQGRQALDHLLEVRLACPSFRPTEVLTTLHVCRKCRNSPRRRRRRGRLHSMRQRSNEPEFRLGV